MVGVWAVILSATTMAEQAPAVVELPPTLRCATLIDRAGCTDAPKQAPRREARPHKRAPASVARTFQLEIEFSSFGDFLPAPRGRSDGAPRTAGGEPDHGAWVPEPMIDVGYVPPILTSPQLGAAFSHSGVSP